MRRPAKKNPELNVVTFCDIVTVSIVAMFMVLVIVIDQVMKTPDVRPVPLAYNTTNQPVYFECRSNQLYYIDRAELRDALQRNRMELAAKGIRLEDMLKAAAEQDIGNEYYQLDNGFLVMGITALRPRPNVAGLPLDDVDEEDSRFQRMVRRVNKDSQFVVYLVRDDSFMSFRRIRDLTVQMGILTGWEYIGRDEPITFEGMFGRVKAE